MNRKLLGWGFAGAVGGASIAGLVALGTTDLVPEPDPTPLPAVSTLVPMVDVSTPAPYPSRSVTPAEEGSPTP